MKKTGRVLMTAELGEEYGFVDINGEEFFFKKISTSFARVFSRSEKVRNFLSNNVIVLLFKLSRQIDLASCEFTFLHKDDHVIFILGLRVGSYRSISVITRAFPRVKQWTKRIPQFIKFPYWLMSLAGSKF